MRPCSTIMPSAAPPPTHTHTHTHSYVLTRRPAYAADATYFRDVNAGGQGYIVWKEDANSVGRPTTIYATPVSDSGRNITGDSVPLFANDPSSWEGAVTEGPWVVNHNGFYYVFYSGACVRAHVPAAAGRRSCCGAQEPSASLPDAPW